MELWTGGSPLGSAFVCERVDSRSQRARRPRGAHDGPRLIVVGGLAGAGKTALLSHLAADGEQTLDLEAMAHHRGSAFGHLGQPTQPSNETFSELVAAALRAADPTRPLYVEDEGRYIGSVCVPPALADEIESSPVLWLEATAAERLARLLASYAVHPPADLVAAIDRLAPRIGIVRARRAREAVLDDRPQQAVEQLL